MTRCRLRQAPRRPFPDHIRCPSGTVYRNDGGPERCAGKLRKQLRRRTSFAGFPSGPDSLPRRCRRVKATVVPALIWRVRPSPRSAPQPKMSLGSLEELEQLSDLEVVDAFGPVARGIVQGLLGGLGDLVALDRQEQVDQ